MESQPEFRTNTSSFGGMKPRACGTTARTSYQPLGSLEETPLSRYRRTSLHLNLLQIQTDRRVRAAVRLLLCPMWMIVLCRSPTPALAQQGGATARHVVQAFNSRSELGGWCGRETRGSGQTLVSCRIHINDWCEATLQGMCAGPRSFAWQGSPSDPTACPNVSSLQACCCWLLICWGAGGAYDGRLNGG